MHLFLFELVFQAGARPVHPTGTSLDGGRKEKQCGEKLFVETTTSDLYRNLLQSSDRSVRHTLFLHANLHVLNMNNYKQWPL